MQFLNLSSSFWSPGERGVHSAEARWFDKILMTVESHQPNFANIWTALKLLSFLLNILVSGELLYKTSLFKIFYPHTELWK